MSMVIYTVIYLFTFLFVEMSTFESMVVAFLAAILYAIETKK